ncbi:hypothetical protein BRC2024_KCUCJSVR_CDS_0086 [Acinetobacter phage vB_AbaM_KissB]|uniref:hypothetical protein n=1 Tax=Acinetobacter phage vB_AbaM_phiAbaA1 TaxID=1605379 RepID=UPI00078C5A33|nr:hypothetical protein BJD49_gp090 [Acinetobacter phage vB_AbaM_phiAbaA1]AJK27200.1 hypothetical protein phiAbaA1_097 [Acinetobacter phage vB_AbaM_phiAbaA1]
MKSNVGKFFCVKTGSYLSGEVGECIEHLTKKQHKVQEDYVKLVLDETVMWFKLSEVREV